MRAVIARHRTPRGSSATTRLFLLHSPCDVATASSSASGARSRSDAGVARALFFVSPRVVSATVLVACGLAAAGAWMDVPRALVLFASSIACGALGTLGVAIYAGAVQRPAFRHLMREERWLTEIHAPVFDEELRDEDRQFLARHGEERLRRRAGGACAALAGALACALSIVGGVDATDEATLAIEPGTRVARLTDQRVPGTIPRQLPGEIELLSVEGARAADVVASFARWDVRTGVRVVESIPMGGELRWFGRTLRLASIESLAEPRGVQVVVTPRDGGGAPVASQLFIGQSIEVPGNHRLELAAIDIDSDIAREPVLRFRMLDGDGAFLREVVLPGIPNARFDDRHGNGGISVVAGALVPGTRAHLVVSPAAPVARIVAGLLLMFLALAALRSPLWVVDGRSGDRVIRRLGPASEEGPPSRRLPANLFDARIRSELDELAARLSAERAGEGA